MIIMLVLRTMNSLVIMGVAMMIPSEKLLPGPEIIARLVGISPIVAGVASFV